MDPHPVVSFVEARAAETPGMDGIPARMLLAAWVAMLGVVERTPVPYSHGLVEMCRVALICEATRWMDHEDFDEKWVKQIGYRFT
jgi:hypothetical protein